MSDHQVVPQGGRLEACLGRARCLLAIGVAIVLAATDVAVGQDLVNVRWRLSASDGRLQVQCQSSESGRLEFEEWSPLFPDWRFSRGSSSREAVRDIVELGPFGILPLVWHGPGGACALDEGARRLDRLSIGRSVLELASGPVDDMSLDLLRVKELAKIPELSATYALREYAKSAKDSFVKAVALAELGARGEPYNASVRDGAAHIPKALAVLPDRWDWIVGLDCSGAETLMDWFSEWRSLWRRHASAFEVETGGSVALLPALASMQKAMDRPGQLPAEIGRVIGNWRVDYVCVAGYPASDRGLFVYIGGVFAPEDVMRGLRSIEAGGIRTTADGVVCTIAEWKLTVMRNCLLVESTGAEHASRGADAQRLLKLAQSGTAWVRVDDVARCGLGDGSGCCIEATLSETMISGILGGEGAVAMIAWWERFKRDMGCGGDSLLPGNVRIAEVVATPAGSREREKMAIAWRRAIQATVVDRGDAGFKWRTNLGSLEMLDRMRLMVKWPDEVVAMCRR